LDSDPLDDEKWEGDVSEGLSTSEMRNDIGGDELVVLEDDENALVDAHNPGQVTTLRRQRWLSPVDQIPDRLASPCSSRAPRFASLFMPESQQQTRGVQYLRV
jgi:hypothetical protein